MWRSVSLVKQLETFEEVFPPRRGFKGNRWTIRVVLADIGGRWECISLSIDSEPGKPAALTTSMMRKIPLSRLIQAARVAADGKKWGTKPVAVYESGLNEVALGASSEFARALRGEAEVRSRLSQEHFAKVAATYQRLTGKAITPRWLWRRDLRCLSRLQPSGFTVAGSSSDSSPEPREAKQPASRPLRSSHGSEPEVEENNHREHTTQRH
jgi:hypothetical protein